MYDTKYNTLQTQNMCAWVANNLALLYIYTPFLATVARYNKHKKPKNHTSNFVYHLLFIATPCLTLNAAGNYIAIQATCVNGCWDEVKCF